MSQLIAFHRSVCDKTMFQNKQTFDIKYARTFILNQIGFVARVLGVYYAYTFYKYPYLEIQAAQH